MMSRTCRSATSSTPSSIGSASASSRPRVRASRRISSSCCAVLRLARRSVCVSRLQPASRSCCCPWPWLRAPVGVGEAEAAQHRDLAALHAPRLRVALVVVADQMQRAVHHQVRPVRLERPCAARAPPRAPPARRSPGRPSGRARAAGRRPPAAAAAGTTARWSACPGRDSGRSGAGSRADPTTRTPSSPPAARRPSAAPAHAAMSRGARRPRRDPPLHLDLQLHCGAGSRRLHGCVDLRDS